MEDNGTWQKNQNSSYRKGELVDKDVVQLVQVQVFPVEQIFNTDNLV